jgi:hypothetical protein
LRVVVAVVVDVVVIVRLWAVGLHIISPEGVPVYILVPFPSVLGIMVENIVVWHSRVFSEHCISIVIIIFRIFDVNLNFTTRIVS